MQFAGRAAVLRWVLVLALIGAATTVVALAWQHAGTAQRSGAAVLLPCPGATPCKRVIDLAGVLPRADVPRFEDYLAWMARESGVDLRLAFVAGTGQRSIEDFAARAMDELHIATRSGPQRGVLLLYDTRAHKLKVKVGDGLEAYFPDAFVDYLVHQHTPLFFSTSDLSTGLRLLLRLLQQRIREATLGNAFDPGALLAVSGGGAVPAVPFGGGAGANAAMATPVLAGTAATRVSTAAAAITPMTQAERNQFAAGDTPELAYSTYLAWLGQPKFDPEVAFLTAGSRRYLAGFPASTVYRHFILFGEYGKPHRIEQRGDLALLYFTGTPFASPHFFVRQDGHWQMDMQAEVRNTAEHVGAHYTWSYRGQDDIYSSTFGDLLVQFGPFRRFKNGDNRKLVVNGYST